MPKWRAVGAAATMAPRRISICRSRPSSLVSGCMAKTLHDSAERLSIAFLEEAARPEFPPEAVNTGEAVAREPRRLGAFDVFRLVVDHHGRLRLEAVSGDKTAIDLGIGLL